MNALICPLCAEPLGENSNGLHCVNHHQFDRSKEGYFNLLPVQFKHSRQPGDAKQQLLARRDFLAAGYFMPLAEKLREIISPNVATILDIGCGEGYFTRLLSSYCCHAETYGIDIAKVGVRLAAKHGSPRLRYLVASSYSLPIADASMDIVTRIYAPSKDQELFRVLKSDGKLIIVTPGEEHLIALRKTIYASLKPYVFPEAPERFKIVGQYSLNFLLDMPPGAMSAALLQMTPFLWKLNPELLRHTIDTGLIDRAHFHISVYEKVERDLGRVFSL